MSTLVPETDISGMDELLLPTNYCVMQLLIPALDNYFWPQSPHICYDDITHMAEPCSSVMSFYVDETIEFSPESESENYARMILT